MQFTAQTQQLTTCPQCDNVVRIDAEFCNICGKRLRQATAGSATPAVPPAPGGPGPARRWLGRASAWARERVGQARQAVADAAHLLGQSVTHGRQYVQALLPFRRQLLLSVAVGTAAGVAAYCSTPLLAAAAAWLGGFATALAVQGALLLRQWLLLASVRGAEPLAGGREA